MLPRHHCGPRNSSGVVLYGGRHDAQAEGQSPSCTTRTAVGARSPPRILNADLLPQNALPEDGEALTTATAGAAAVEKARQSTTRHDWSVDERGFAAKTAGSTAMGDFFPGRSHGLGSLSAQIRAAMLYIEAA